MHAGFMGCEDANIKRLYLEFGFWILAFIWNLDLVTWIFFAEIQGRASESLTPVTFDAAIQPGLVSAECDLL